MEALRNVLQDNNILLQKNIEEQEFEHFAVRVKKIKIIYVINKNQPIVKLIQCKTNIIGDNIVLDETHFAYFSELIKLEQGNIIIE